MPDDGRHTAEATLASRVVQHVLQAAEHGQYRHAERLPSERELAEQMAVSRNTVTAAYTELEQRGVLRRLQGKGAYLCALPESHDAFSWSGKVSRFANALDEPVLELLARRCADDLLYPFSAGTPSLEVFPKQAYTTSMQRVLEAAIPEALAVAPAEGQWRLRAALGTWLGLPARNIMITAGAQEGLDLLARCLIEPGDSVVVDAPTYPGALQSFLSAGAHLLPWATDWSLGRLEDLFLRYRPKFLFTTPTFHNPTGRVMREKTRLALLTLAARYKVPVLEDDVYSRTSFGTYPVPHSLYQLDQHAQVIAVSTFSKMFAPGLRLGWLTAPPYMIKQLALIKMRSNLFTGGLNQLVLADLIERGDFDEHLENLRGHHRTLCEAALTALRPSLDRGLLQVSAPAGSLYLWCKLLQPIDTELLYAALEAQSLSVAPGVAFEPERERRSSVHFRLCFTATTRARLVEGIAILNTVLRAARTDGPVQTEENLSLSMQANSA